ncbi:DNA repair protein XRCC2-like [Anneissia japonica]|uniref:DNA repair protein XRCC2-like n=1 Tax=Anneissia japonica TaxID=1529436 RepID=UPI001425A091|nr:DNA repair protein XRCC2-like [Anneissia japonica]
MLAESDGFNKTEVETCAQLFMRLASKPSLESLDLHLFPSHFPKPGEVVEIHGASATGKTELLMHFISKCILPKRWNTLLINGIEAEVVLIDTDFKFSVIRLYQILKEQLMKIIDVDSNDICTSSWAAQTETLSSKTHSKEPSKKDQQTIKNEKVLEELVQSCLDRLYLVRCSSSEQLLITLHSMENVFSKHPQMTVLMLDSVSSFYWEDRVKTGDNWKSFEALQDNIIDLLQKLVQDYRLVVFLTKNSTSQHFKSGKFSHNPNTDHGQIEAFDCKYWSKLSAHRLILTRDDFPFPVVVKGNEMYASYFVKVFNKKEHHHCKFYINSNGILYA